MPTLLSLLLACHAGDGDAPAVRFDDAVSDLAATTERHGRDVSTSQDRGAIGGMEDDYWTFCQANRDTMSSCMDAFRECGGMDGGMMGGGMMGSMEDWDGLMDDLWGGMQEHHDAMAACEDVACCHDEEERWQDHMSGWLDEADGTEPAWTDDCE